jgi:glycosyltransferase involved in cell wall biosynthesis
MKDITSAIRDHDNPPELAFLLPDLRGGGAEVVMLALADEFAKMGFTPHFLLARAEGELLNRVLDANYPVTAFEAKRLRHVARPLRGWLQQNRPHCLIPVMWPLTSLAIWAARSTHVPVITSDHNTFSQQQSGKGLLHRLVVRSSIRATYPFAQARLSVSHGAARDLERFGWLGKGMIDVIHNPIKPPNPATNTESQPAIWRRNAPHKILAVGSFRRQKDFPNLLRAFRKLLDQGMDAELVILGEGSDRHHLEQLTNTLAIQDRVALPGFCADPSIYYSTADLFVLSSRYEGFANVIVEALSHGLRVVSTDCPSGPAEILTDKSLGTLVPVEDSDALAQAIVSRLALPHDPLVARKRAKDFEPKIAAQKLVALLPAFTHSDRADLP